jgi:hypothetical protein
VTAPAGCHVAPPPSPPDTRGVRPRRPPLPITEAVSRFVSDRTAEMTPRDTNRQRTHNKRPHSPWLQGTSAATIRDRTPPDPVRIRGRGGGTCLLLALERRSLSCIHASVCNRGPAIQQSRSGQTLRDRSSQRSVRPVSALTAQGPRRPGRGSATRPQESAGAPAVIPSPLLPDVLT